MKTPLMHCFVFLILFSSYTVKSEERVVYALNDTPEEIHSFFSAVKSNLIQLTDSTENLEKKYGVVLPATIEDEGSILSSELDNISVNAKKYEEVYRSSKSLITATKNGVGYSDYSPLARAFFTSAEIAKDQAMSNNEVLLASAYYDVAQLLISADKFWNSSIQVKVKYRESIGDDSILKAFKVANIILNKTNAVYLDNYRNPKKHKKRSE